eukprot:9473007-Pyramimonas_sp.AAC.1
MDGDSEPEGGSRSDSRSMSTGDRSGHRSAAEFEHHARACPNLTPPSHVEASEERVDLAALSEQGAVLASVGARVLGDLFLLAGRRAREADGPTRRA